MEAELSGEAPMDRGEKMAFALNKCVENKRELREAFSKVWDSVTDTLEQADITRIESLHTNEFNLLNE